VKRQTTGETDRYAPEFIITGRWRVEARKRPTEAFIQKRFSGFTQDLGLFRCAGLNPAHRSALRVGWEMSARSGSVSRAGISSAMGCFKSISNSKKTGGNKLNITRRQSWQAGERKLLPDVRSLTPQETSTELPTQSMHLGRRSIPFDYCKVTKKLLISLPTLMKIGHPGDSKYGKNLSSPSEILAK